MPCSLPSRSVSDVRPPATTDEELLGAQAASVATEHTETERLARIHDELARGFEALAHITRGVSIFGSARTPVGSPIYELTRRFADSDAAVVMKLGRHLEKVRRALNSTGRLPYDGAVRCSVDGAAGSRDDVTAQLQIT